MSTMFEEQEQRVMTQPDAPRHTGDVIPLQQSRRGYGAAVVAAPANPSVEAIGESAGDDNREVLQASGRGGICGGCGRSLTVTPFFLVQQGIV